MLVLSRKIGEKIIIDETITVEVLEIRGERVRLGVEAPKEIPVVRTNAKNKQPKVRTKVTV